MPPAAHRAEAAGTTQDFGSNAGSNGYEFRRPKLNRGERFAS